jgi:hypothetical protein
VRNKFKAVIKSLPMKKSSQIKLDFFAREIREEKEIKGIQIQK